MSRYSYTTTLSLGTDGEPDYSEVEVEVSYLVSWGAPEQGPSYASGGQPADPDEIDDIRLEKVEGKSRPWTMYDGHFPSDDDEFEQVVIEMLDDADLLTEAAEQAAADHHEAMEYRAEQCRDDALFFDHPPGGHSHEG